MIGGMNDIETEVWRTVQALNRTWTEGNVDDLEAFFHPDIVVVTPTERERLEGREACVAAWRRFVNAATIRIWKEIDPAVRVHGDAAVVTYYYELSCEIEGREVSMAGRDMFFLVREDGRWLTVADQFSGFPGSDVPG